MHNAARTGTYQVKSAEPREMKQPKEKKTPSAAHTKTDGRNLTQDVQDYILDQCNTERALGKKTVVLVSGDIEKKMGWSNRMPIVCLAMYSFMKSDDVVLHTTPSGKSSTIEIEYHL